MPLSGILGRSYHPLIQAALAPSEVPDLTRVHQTRRRETVELAHGPSWVHITADPVLDDRGRVSGSVHIFADITLSKKVEEERTRLLAERAELADHLRLLLESTGEGIFGVDRAGNCTFINRAAAALFGVVPQDFVGQNVHTQVHHTYSDGRPYPPEECPIIHAMASGTGCRTDTEVLWRRDGTWFPAEYSAHPIRTSAGIICGAVVTFTDITERKQMEQRLRHSQKMEAVGRLAGGVAHDFNNLMAVILGNVSLLLSEFPRNQAHRDMLLAVDQAAWRASELTRRLLGFSRQSKLWLKPLDLRFAVNETVNLLRRTIDPRVAVEVVHAPDLWIVQADAGQINQVLMNLCLNARDAMPDGGRLLLRTENVILDERAAQQQAADARPGEFVRLRVVDGGHGIQEEVLPRIFEPFFTTKEPGKGTGLGLAVVFGIIKQHQGWITCNSEVNQGTCFEIFLPRTKAALAPAMPVPAAPSPEPGHETILVVDDEPMLRMLMQKILQEYGYQVLLAADGLEALDIYRKEKDTIDLVLLDLTMPRLSGQDTMRQLRDLNPQVRVIYVSGYAVKMSEAGRDPVLGVIAKPFRPDELLQAVRAGLDKVAKL